GGGRGEGFVIMWWSLAAEEGSVSFTPGSTPLVFRGQEGGKAEARRPSPPLTPTFPFLLMGLSHAQGFAFGLAMRAFKRVKPCQKRHDSEVDLYAGKLAF